VPLFVFDAYEFTVSTYRHSSCVTGQQCNVLYIFHILHVNILCYWRLSTSCNNNTLCATDLFFHHICSCDEM